MSKRLAGRFGYPKDDPFRPGTFHPDKLQQPFKWKKPLKIFVCSMGDLFHEDVTYGQINQIMRVIAVNERHTFIVLTKRPEKMQGYFEHLSTFTGAISFESPRGDFDRSLHKYAIHFRTNKPLKNLWLGVTAENQEQADKRIPVLLQIPAAVRFVSIEPMLGPVNIESYLKHPTMPDRIVKPGSRPIEYIKVVGCDWVICGGETGPRAREMQTSWPRSILYQCQKAGVPFFFKQWGERQKRGRIIDGKAWNEFPE